MENSYTIYTVKWDCNKGWEKPVAKGQNAVPFPWFRTYGFPGSGYCTYATATDTVPEVPSHLLPCEGC